MPRYYKLLKDLPIGNAGEIVFEHNGTICFREDGVICSTGLLADMLCENSWFEEIQEPTESIHWSPKDGEEYWYIGDDGPIRSIRFSSYDGDDVNRLMIGNVYLTKAEAEKDRDRKLAEATLRRTSTFELDFENGNGGWIVRYDYECGTLRVSETDYYDAGEIVRYKTEKEAKKSIKEHEEDWLIYFGIKGGE